MVVGGRELEGWGEGGSLGGGGRVENPHITRAGVYCSVTLNQRKRSEALLRCYCILAFWYLLLTHKDTQAKSF